MFKSDTDNYSTIDESIASTESTLRYCLWKKGTQFTYDIPDGLIVGDCVVVKGRLTGKQVVLELSGAPTRIPSVDEVGKDEEHRIVPLRLRFSRGGRYKLHSDYLGREAARRGRFRCDFQSDGLFEVQIRILEQYYDIRINDIELVKLDHGQLHNEIQMLSLDGEAEFSAVDFIDLDDLVEETATGLPINLPMGEPMNNSSPASEPELMMPQKLVQKNAHQKATEKVEDTSSAGAMDHVDSSPPSAQQQKRSRNREDELDSEMPHGVNSKKTKLLSSPSRENDVNSSVLNQLKSDLRQRMEEEDSLQRSERRSRDRRPRQLEAEQFTGAQHQMTEEKRPKQSDGELKRSKRSTEQFKTIQPENSEQHHIDNTYRSETKQDGPKIKTRMENSSRTSSKASNSSTSESAELANHDVKQRRHRTEATGSKERPRTSRSPETKEKRRILPDENSKVETQKQSRRSKYPLEQEKSQFSDQTQRAQEDEPDNLRQAKRAKQPSQEPSELGYSKSETKVKRQISQENKPETNEETVLADEEVLKPESVRLTQMQPQRQLSATSSGSELQAPSRITTHSSKRDKSSEQDPQQTDQSFSLVDSNQQATDKSVSSEHKRPSSAFKPYDAEDQSEAQKQTKATSFSAAEADHQQENSVTPVTKPVAEKSSKLKLDNLKTSKPKLNATKPEESSIPSDQAALGSYGFPIHSESIKSGSFKKKKAVVSPTLNSEQNQDSEVLGSYKMQQKPAKQRLSATKPDASIQKDPSGSYNATKTPVQRLKSGIELQQGSEVSSLHSIEGQQPLKQRPSQQKQLPGGDSTRAEGLTKNVATKRRGSAGEKVQTALDGVYRVVPITPVVVTASTTATQKQQQQLLLNQKQLKQQSQQNTIGMSDPLWRSEQLDDEDLVGLTTTEFDSTDNPAVQDDRKSSKSSSSGLSSVAEANAANAEPSADAPDLTQQYMYYAADESSADLPSPAADAALASSPVEMARDASAFVVEPQQQHHQHLQPSDVIRLESTPGSPQINLERSSNQSKTDAFDTKLNDNANEAFQKSGPPSEGVYADSKVYDTITVESEPEPFVAHLPEPLRSGRRIIVSGQFNDNTKRATMSLRNRNIKMQNSASQAGLNEEEEFFVQLKQKDEDGPAELTCRQFNGREWTSEQRCLSRAVQSDNSANFCVEIHTSSVAFTVRAFGDALCIQPHTIPFSNFTHLVLDGSTEYRSIEFPEELELPYSEEFPQSLELVSHILVKLQLFKSSSQAPSATSGHQSPVSFGLDHGAAMLCLLDPVKQTVSVGRTVPETGGFLCETKVDRLPELAKLNSIMLRMEPESVLILLDGKPVLSYNLSTRKHYITSFFVDGNFLLKDVTWKEKRAPKWTPMPPSFQVGRSIRVSGLLPQDGRSVCCVALTVDHASPDSKTADADSDAPFCLRCEPGQQPIVTTAAPSAAVATMQRPPLLPGQRFEAHILCRLTGFEVTLGDLEAGACQVAHSVDPSQLRSVRLTGGAVFYEVEFPEQLGLPYLNRFPVSLKESRFVTVDVLCGLHAPRPNTISFALCTGPGDACLKPLVCEFNMAQGYASVAWSNPAGDLLDEDTRKFDPRLAVDVETVALQATDTDYILSVNETAVLKYPVRHSLDDIRFVLIDGDICITSVQFEGKAASPSCCIN